MYLELEVTARFAYRVNLFKNMDSDRLKNYNLSPNKALSCDMHAKQFHVGMLN